MPQQRYLPELEMWANDVLVAVNSDGSAIGNFGTGSPVTHVGGSIYLPGLGIYSGGVVALVNPDGSPIAFGTADFSQLTVTATGGTTARTLADWMSIFETDPNNIGLDGVRTEGYAAGATKNINFGGVPISPTTSWLWGRQFVTGAPLPSSGGIMSPNTIVVNDTSTPTDPYAMSAMYVAHRVGVGATGTHQAFMADIGVTGGDATTSYSAYVGAVSAAYASANVGGDGTFTTDPNTGYAGGLFGGNDNARLASGATNWFLVIGREINTVIQTGASAFARIGLLFATSSIAGAQAVGDDAAIAISNSQIVPPVPWKNGIQFGTSWGLWAFDSTSTLIGTQKRLYGVPETVIDAGYGIDFNDVTFANFAFRSPGFSVDPDGDIVGNSITVGGSNVATSLAGKVSKAGDTMTGALAIAPSTGTASAAITSSDANSILQMFKSASGSQTYLDIRTGSTAAGQRWRWTFSDTTAEGGSDAGSNFGLSAYSDAGGFLFAPFAITRSTGLITTRAITTTGTITASGTNVIVAGGAVQTGYTTAIPAGGAATLGFKGTSTANFGLFFGSGAPTLTAAKGSIYLRSDGSTTNDRMYVNTNGSTTWTAVTTVA